MTQTQPTPVIVAVDPGRDKCGLAALTEAGDVDDLRILAIEDLTPTVAEIARQRPVLALLVGDGTGSAQVLAELATAELDSPPQTVPEYKTTLRARERYFVDNPPRGWRTLIPRGMLIPPRPVDDYAALVMAEDWLKSHRQHNGDGAT